MQDIDLLHRLGVALAIGLLVGAERHWRERDEPGGQRTAGVRTFGLIGLFGGVAGAIGCRRLRNGARVEFPLRVEPRGLIEPFAWLVKEL